MPASKSRSSGMQTFLPWLVLQGAWLDVNHSPCGLGSCVARVGRAAPSMDEGSPRPVDGTTGGTYTCAENAVTRAPCGARAGSSRFECLVQSATTRVAVGLIVRGRAIAMRSSPRRAPGSDPFAVSPPANSRSVAFAAADHTLQHATGRPPRSAPPYRPPLSCSTPAAAHHRVQNLVRHRRTPKGESARRPPGRVRST